MNPLGRIVTFLEALPGIQAEELGKNQMVLNIAKRKMEGESAASTSAEPEEKV